MYVYRITADAAFELLIWRSQESNVKIRAQAEQVIADIQSFKYDEGSLLSPFFGTFDLYQLRFTESRWAVNQSRGGRAEHHPTRRCHSLHPLRHSDLLTDRGVTQSA